MTGRRLASVLRHRVARDAVARSVREAGRATAVGVWLVGGYVRDAALGRRSADIDLVAGRGARALVRRLEQCWSSRAFRFRKRGVTTWRLVVGDRRVDVVDAGSRGLEQDLRRRELTVNAVAYDLIEQRVFDPLRGLTDLRAGRLRMPRPGVMLEDPVRAVRAARFLAQLPGFRLHREAEREASRAGPGLRRAAVERIREELEKLLDAEAPQRGLAALQRLGVLDAVLPELAPMRHCRAGRDRPDVWRHTLDAIARSASPGRLPGAAALRRPDARRPLRWALLLHDISKPETLDLRDDGRPTFHSHEVLGARRAEALLERLRLPKRQRRRIGRLILNHLRPGHLADAGAPPRGLRRLVREAGDDLPLLVLHAACDAHASGSPDADRRWRRLRPVLVRLLELSEQLPRKPLPALVDGRELMRALGIGSGPLVGELLRGIREKQEEGEIRTREEALIFAADRARRVGRRPRTPPE